jgi:superfamily I DNA and/or RNA helicase
MKILKDYKLVFSTLSSIGHQIVINSDVNFDTVIIDEAGQSIEI